MAARLRELQATLGLGGEVTVELVARQPDVLTSRANGAGEIAWSEIEPVVAAAGAECRAMRAREGEALTAELRHRLDLLERSAADIARRAPERLTRERVRLKASVAELLDGRTVDEDRLAQELAFLADKLDITEELVRFQAHAAAARAAARVGQAGGQTARISGPGAGTRSEHHGRQGRATPTLRSW